MTSPKVQVYAELQSDATEGLVDEFDHILTDEFDRFRFGPRQFFRSALSKAYIEGVRDGYTQSAIAREKEDEAKSKTQS